MSDQTVSAKVTVSYSIHERPLLKSEGVNGARSHGFKGGQSPATRTLDAHALPLRAIRHLCQRVLLPATALEQAMPHESHNRISLDQLLTVLGEHLGRPHRTVHRQANEPAKLANVNLAWTWIGSYFSSLPRRCLGERCDGPSGTPSPLTTKLECVRMPQTLCRLKRPASSLRRMRPAITCCHRVTRLNSGNLRSPEMREQRANLTGFVRRMGTESDSRCLEMGRKRPGRPTLLSLCPH